MIEVYPIRNSTMNAYMKQHHYLHRFVVNSKMIAYGIWQDGMIVGGLIWASPHFQRKKNLFGYPGTYDKYEVLVLARFFKHPLCDAIPSDIMSECIGKRVRHRGHTLPVGWKLQLDWVNAHPPIWPEKPFVPRLLLSWSDLALPTVEVCETCGMRHNGYHQGTIYAASGWQRFDITTSVASRHGNKKQQHAGMKQSWIYPLDVNPLADERGRLLHLSTGEKD